MNKKSGKTAFLFPGQGAQYVGMGASFFEECSCSRRLYEQAEQVTGLNLKNLIFRDNEELNQTEYTQIALYVTEVSMLAAVEEAGIHSDVNLGLSLGEYTALTASQALQFTDGCRVVRKRGALMEHAVPHGQGAMAAILDLRQEQIDQVMQRLDCPLVSVANYNCPGQIVISGETKQLERVSEELKRAGARRIVTLNVSGPFHSPMLQKAGLELGNTLNTIEFQKFEKPYLSNVTAEYVTASKEADLCAIKDLLIQQVYSPVRFEESVRKLLQDGVTTLIEIGPGKTLSGFVRKIVRDMEQNDQDQLLVKAEDIIIEQIEITSDLERVRKIYESIGR